ncbi:hypothetical protein N5918_01055 [Glaesserella parasuis]|uniref:hypothetical protein n=1 Tax=Glaesserella parasuis TaxID=738 RepID=UPI0003AC26A0|nr:hypothetical protein [Glaesserella parasuis]EQA03755.1 hypothetical protein HPSSW114_0393 [Glaesserella parasuis SW114]ATW43462.1 hypothetical protein A2U20_06480 [Glaesserella parasuis D74]EQA10946.1 hypothetical protein HPSD74_0648 [Glaesserella parasuis D74]MCT8824708.1 hypothetical protein [Glaesserella parasuis]MDD2171712.1 hypothetical protein [Glaesserella parasuis]
MKNLEQLIALQQQIIQMSEPLTAEDLKKMGFAVLNLRAVYDFDLSQPQPPHIVQVLAQEMPVILKALQSYLAKSTS